MTELVEMSVVKSENINGMMLDAYYMNGEPWFTRAQIAAALGYNHPKYVAKIHERHSERLDRFSGVVKLSTPGGEQNVYVYSERGVLEICRYSNSPVADAVMDTVFSVYLWVKEEVKKQEIEAACQLVLEQVREGEAEKVRKTEDLIKNEMKYVGPAEYRYMLREIWGDDRERIDLEMRKRDSMEAAENELLGRPRQAYLYGMQNPVINDLEKYWPGNN